MLRAWGFAVEVLGALGKKQKVCAAVSISPADVYALRVNSSSDLERATFDAECWHVC